MGVSNNLANAVSSRDIQSVRDSLSACIVFDPNLTGAFPEGLQYCLEHGIAEDELYEKHDGRSLDRAETLDAFSDLCGELGSNFSRERIEAIKVLGRKLRPPKNKTGDVGHRAPRKAGSDNGSSVVQLAGLIVGGALVGGIVGGIILKKALIGAVVGGVAGFAAEKIWNAKRS